MDQYLNKSFNQKEDKNVFQRIRDQERPQSEQKRITLEDNAQFGLTFGRQETQTISKLFQTPPFKIHKKQSSTNNTSNKNTQNPCLIQLKKRAQSALCHQYPLKQLDLEGLREKMSKITYSIKTIQSKNDEEIGVTSKRVIMANKLLENKKKQIIMRFNTNRSRCSSSNKFYELGGENNVFDSKYHTERPIVSKEIIPHNKFISKRLNVLIKKKKSSFGKNHERSWSSNDHFAFCPEETKEMISERIHYEEKTKVNGLNKITFRNNKENILNTVENKRLKYETLMAKKSTNPQIQFRSTNKNSLQNLALGQNIMLSQHAQSLTTRKQKVSLSNLLSQYHTQIIENSNNILIERSDFCQPLKQLFKNKFSTISKTVHNEGKQMLEKNLMKINMRKHSVSKKQFDNVDHQGKEKQIINFRKFKKYQEIEKENAYLMGE